MFLVMRASERRDSPGLVPTEVPTGEWWRYARRRSADSFAALWENARGNANERLDEVRLWIVTVFPVPPYRITAAGLLGYVPLVKGIECS